MARLEDMELGESIVIPTSSGYVSFIIVYQGSPSSKYYNADGTWVLMSSIYTTSGWSDGMWSRDNTYSTSNVYTLLEKTFYESITDEVKEVIKEVRVPYINGKGSSGSYCTGSNGLSCHVFAPSLYECGITSSSHAKNIGVTIPYVQSNRALSSYSWYTRTPNSEGRWQVWYIDTDGEGDYGYPETSRGVRGMMVLDSSYIYNYGTFSLNSPPVITSNYGTSLGTITEGFDYTYTVSDEDDYTFSVVEYYDNVQQNTHTVYTETEYTMDNVSEDNWQTILNGEHSFEIVAFDTYDTTTRTTTFTKKITKCIFTMKSPIAIAASYTELDMYVEGSIPSDATFKVEITINATATSPTWTDITTYVKNGKTYTFDTSSTLSSRYFNFRVTASRGSSDAAGYITRVWGTFVRPQSDE